MSTPLKELQPGPTESHSSAISDQAPSPADTTKCIPRWIVALGSRSKKLTVWIGAFAAQSTEPPESSVARGVSVVRASRLPPCLSTSIRAQLLRSAWTGFPQSIESRCIVSLPLPRVPWNSLRRLCEDPVRRQHAWRTARCLTRPSKRVSTCCLPWRFGRRVWVQNSER